MPLIAERHTSPSRSLDQLVANLRDLHVSTGAATEDDLARLGWRTEDVKRLLPAARLRLGLIGDVGHG